MKIYDLPIKTFNPDNLLEEMLKSKNGSVFVLGEKRTKHPEGDDSVELITCEIKISKD